ncbi:MAG: acylphosphatase [Bryobacteraceae bacterium]|jgi:acylphosphatase
MPRAKKPGPAMARRYFIQGRVQGVGYRYFAESVAAELGIAGYARNLDDGRVEVYAVGTTDQLSALSGYLRKGPRMADVHGVQEMEAPVNDLSEFRIEYFS